MCSLVCVFFRRGMLRRCAGTRSWEKRWQREKPQQVLHPTSNPPLPNTNTPTLRNTPLSQLIPHVPTSPPPAILPHATMKVPQPDETPPRDSGRFEWGWGWIQKWKRKKELKKRKINVSHPLFPKKENVFAPFQMRRKEKNLIDKWQWVLVFVNTSFFVIYSTIQAAKVLIAVCHFIYKFPLLAYIWM